MPHKYTFESLIRGHHVGVLKWRSVSRFSLLHVLNLPLLAPMRFLPKAYSTCATSRWALMPILLLGLARTISATNNTSNPGHQGLTTHVSRLSSTSTIAAPTECLQPVSENSAPLSASTSASPSSYFLLSSPWQSYVSHNFPHRPKSFNGIEYRRFSVSWSQYTSLTVTLLCYFTGYGLERLRRACHFFDFTKTVTRKCSIPYC